MKEQHYSFDAVTRKNICEKFRDALLKANPEFVDFDGSALRESDIFTRCLEDIAGQAGCWRVREEQKRRRERIEAIANSVDELIRYARAADDAALGYVLWAGLSEAFGVRNVFSDDNRADLQAMEGQPMVAVAYGLQQGREAIALDAFAKGVRNAIPSLPPLDKRAYDFIDQAATFIEDYLGRHNIPVSTSDTGLAGTALIATIELAGLQAPRAGYRLKTAKSDPGSWETFVARLRDRQ